MPETAPSQWYETWFDSPHYHRLYGHRSESEAQRFIQRLHRHFGWEGLRLLDLACGKGRHAAAAAELGHDVVGLDLSPNSIAQAREHYGRLPNLRFVQSDMRIFDLPEFDGILNLFTSFGYFDRAEDQQSVLVQVRKHLSPNGFFLLDFINVPWARRRLVPEETVEREGVTYHIQRSFEPLNDEMNGFVKTIAFEEAGVPHHFTERVAGLDRNALTAMLESAGLVVDQSFGDYALNPYDEASSPRLILMTRTA